ncbi:MAG: universal stress protein, partial [Salibacteraceae bacterium]
AWLSASVIVALNIWLVIEEAGNFLSVTESPILWGLGIGIVGGLALLLLVYVTFVPLFKNKVPKLEVSGVHQEQLLLDISNAKQFHRIAVAVDFSDVDNKVIQHVLSVTNPNTEILLIHVVESVVARVFGKDVADSETKADTEFLENYQKQMAAQGYKVSIKLGYGSPKKTIPKISKDFNADLLVLGSHGHGMMADMLFGTTIDSVRHNVDIPVFIVRE